MTAAPDGTPVLLGQVVTDEQMHAVLDAALAALCRQRIDLVSAGTGRRTSWLSDPVVTAMQEELAAALSSPPASAVAVGLPTEGLEEDRLVRAMAAELEFRGYGPSRATATVAYEALRDALPADPDPIARLEAWQQAEMGRWFEVCRVGDSTWQVRLGEGDGLGFGGSLGEAVDSALSASPEPKGGDA